MYLDVLLLYKNVYYSICKSNHPFVSLYLTSYEQSIKLVVRASGHLSTILPDHLQFR